MVNAIKLALEQAGGKAGALSVTYVVAGLLDARGRRRGRATACSTTRARPCATSTRSPTSATATRPPPALSLPLTNEGNILQVSPTSAYDGLTRAGGVRTGEPERFYPSGKRTFGRMVPPDHVQASALVGYMKSRGRAHARAARRPRARRRRPRRPGRQGRRGAGHRRSSTRAASTRRRATSPGMRADVAATGADAFLFAGDSEHRRGADLRGGRRPRRRGCCCSARRRSPTSASCATLARPSQRRMRITTPTLPPRLLPAVGARLPRRASARAFGRAARRPRRCWPTRRRRPSSARSARPEPKGNDRARRHPRRSSRSENRRSVLGTYSIDRNGDTSLSRFAGNRVRGSRLALDKVLEVRP